MAGKYISRQGSILLAVAAAVLASSPAWALTITPTFDVSITTDANAAAIEGVINSAINVYETTFTDPINVAIKFQEINFGLGQSTTPFYALNYNAVRPAMTTDATTADDATALANTPNTTNNPVNGNSLIIVTTANIRALGIPGSFPPPGGFDGTIGLNTSITFPPQSVSGNFSLLSVTEHQIDEVLGLLSMLPSPVDNAPAVEDLFRFTATGARTFTTAGDDAYFSIDGGATDLARFNQNGGGSDYGDWWSIGAHVAQVQDAFSSPETTPSLGVELTALDVIGYDRAAPEPASLCLLGLGVLGLISRHRRA